MAFRFTKRIKVLPGVTLNLSKSGVSTSLGPRGAKVTLGKKTRTTVGIPGTGLSHTTVHGQHKRAHASTGTTLGNIITAVVLVGILWVFFKFDLWLL